MERGKIGIIGWFMVIMFAVSISSVILQVFFRYVLGNSLTWTNVVSRYAFLWVVFIGSAAALKDGDHIVIDVLLTKVSDKARNVILLIGYFLISLLTGTLTVLGIKVVIATQGSIQTALQLPINMVLYVSLPIGMGLSLIVAVGKIIELLKRMTGKDQTGVLNQAVKEDNR